MNTLKTNELLLREEINEGYESVAHRRWLNASKIREVENVNKKQIVNLDKTFFTMKACV